MLFYLGDPVGVLRDVNARIVGDDAAKGIAADAGTCNRVACRVCYGEHQVSQGCKAKDVYVSRFYNDDLNILFHAMAYLKPA